MIQNAIIKAGATYSLTGGTDRTLSQAGPMLGNVVHVVDTSVTDFRLQPTFDFRTRQPVLQKDGTYQKWRRDVHVVRPKLLASGLYEPISGDVIIKGHPEMTDAEILAMKLDLCQVIMDTDFDLFWKLGTNS